MDGMIARHDALAASRTDHRLVGQQDLFHEFLLVGIATTTIAKVVFRAGTHACLQVTLLESLHKGHTHGGREVAVFTIRLFETVERGDTAHIDHGRECQCTTHLTQGRAGLTCLQLSQFGIERTGLSDLLGIDGSPLGVDAREHLLVEEGRDAVGGVLFQPVLYGCHHVANGIRIARHLEGKL